MKKACIFDLDGTLTDTITAIAYFGNSALAECGFCEFPVDRYKYFVGDGRTKLIERMLEAQNALTAENFNRVCAVYDGMYEANPAYKTEAYPGIKELLSELKTAGIRLAVCSNKPDNVVHGVVEDVFGGDTFDLVCGVVDGKPTKPDKRYTEDVLRRFGMTAEESIFIGDTNVDIFTAKNAGIESVGVLWGFRDREELEAAGAEHIVSAPAEILNFVK